MTGMLTIEALTKVYKQGDDHIFAVNKASFTVQKGEFVALVGQSGSGKTTLLNMIGCIDRPTSGRVLLEGKDLTAMEDEALAALDRVSGARREARTEVGGDFAGEFCDLVRFRLEHPDYLRCPEYGRALLAVFARCRAELPIGFAAFHLPWVLEWHTANRQYRAAFELARDFPLKLPVPEKIADRA